MIRRLVLAVVLAAPVLAAQKPAPLAPFAGTKVAVVPVQFYRSDTTGWGMPAGPALRTAFDSLLSVALDEHGLTGTWATPADVQRSAKRNSMYTSDPRNLGAYPVRNGAKMDDPITEPLAGNLRRVVALHDARYVLVPLELHVESAKDGKYLAVRLLLVDARMSVPVWQGDLMGETAAGYTPRLLEKLANRLAELVVAP
jgi:hypothetical protein